MWESSRGNGHGKSLIWSWKVMEKSWNFIFKVWWEPCICSIPWTDMHPYWWLNEQLLGHHVLSQQERFQIMISLLLGWMNVKLPVAMVPYCLQKHHLSLLYHKLDFKGITLLHHNLKLNLVIENIELKALLFLFGMK